jgi:hypothetical protein
LSVSPASLRWEVANHATAGVKRRRLTPERARQRVTDFERVTIRELAVDRRRAVDLGLHFGIYAYDTYILEGTRSSRFPLLALDGPIRRNAKKLGLSLVGAGSMTLYTYSTARPRVAEGWHGRTENPSAAKNRSGFGCTTRTVSAYPSWNRRPDHGRVVSVRGQRSAVSEEPEMRCNVFSFPTGESDHLDEVPVVDPAGIKSGGDDLELCGRALRTSGAQETSEPRGDRSVTGGGSSAAVCISFFE